MEIVILPLRSKKQKWCIWFKYDNGKSTKLQEHYHNHNDAVDTAEMLKAKIGNAVIKPFIVR